MARDLETGEEQYYPEGHPNAGQPLFMRKFIPSKLSDNPYLAKDGVYEANLLSSQKIREDNFLREIGRLQRGPHSQSFELLYTLVNHSRSQRIGSGFVPATLGTPAFRRSIGLQLILTGEPSTSTESSTSPNIREETSPKPLFGQKRATKFPTESSTVPAGTKEACLDPQSQKK